MKSIILVALALVAVAVALPSKENPQIVRSNNDQNPDGGYNYAFETENGIQKQETGVVKEVLDEENEPHKVVVVRGNYLYTDQDGETVEIKYFADETGYHAEGKSIPQAVSRR